MSLLNKILKSTLCLQTRLPRDKAHIRPGIYDTKIVSKWSAKSHKMLLKLLLLSTFAVISQGVEIKEEYSWKQLQYKWESEKAEQDAIKSGVYIPENNLPLGLARWKDKVFVTVPRRKPGVASSLNYFTVGSDKSPLLHPYPCWGNLLPASEIDTKAISEITESYNRSQNHIQVEPMKDNSSVVSAFRVWVDVCDRLWVMDTGLDNIYGKYSEIFGITRVFALPSIAIFDLNTDTLIKRYTFKDTDFRKSSYFANIVVDVKPDSCSDAFAYVADLTGNALVVYSLEDDDAWRIKHHYFHFDPLAGQYNVGGVTFEWTDGLVGLALSPLQPDGFRKVFFHASSSYNEFEVSSEVLQNKTMAMSSTSFNAYKLLGDKGKNSQSTASFLDEKTGILFYTQVNRDGVACWNTAKSLTPDNTQLFANSSVLLDFPNDIKVIDDKLWILSDRLQRFIYTSLDKDEVNFRILTIPIDDAISGSVCKVQK